MKTLLGRVKGCALDVIVSPEDPTGIMPLLSSHTKQFRSLSFTGNSLRDIQMFSDANYGPLPLLRALEISHLERYGPGGLAITSPSVPFFNNATNLKTFSFCSNAGWSPSLGYFAFPNLTSFRLSVKLDPGYGFSALQLLDFLGASPMLRTVDMKIVATMNIEDVPQDRVVVLRNVDSFNLLLGDYVPVYGFAVHISCPSASSVSLAHTKNTYNVIAEEVFPPSNLWGIIIDQYTRGSLEEVALEIVGHIAPTCRLAFRSSDGSVLKLGFEVTIHMEESIDFRTQRAIFDNTFTQATRIVRDHPQANGVKRLRIHHRSLDGCNLDIADEVSQLFRSLGPLDELTLHRCNVLQYLAPQFNPSGWGSGEKVLFTPIKQLTISHQTDSRIQDIVSLAKANHELGTPFGHVILRGTHWVPWLQEKLKPWVGSVESHSETWNKRDQWDKSFMD